MVPGPAFRYSPDQPGAVTAQTGVDGTFRFAVVKPGSFWLYATAEGYVPGSQLPRSLSLRKSASIQIELVKAPSIEGRIVDEDTRQAIKGIKVKPMPVTYTLGRRTLGLVLPLVEATTDANGNFRLDKLPPGSYTLDLVSPEAEAKVAEAEPKVLEPEHDDEPARTSAYRQQWWPSGSRLDLSRTISLSAGVQLTLPDIRISKEPLFRISGLVNSGTCADGDLYDVFLTRQYGTMYITDTHAAVRCGSAFTITNLAPGDYQVSAGLHQSGGPVAWEAVTVIDRDVRRDLFLALPLIISGIVSFPDSFKAGKLPLALRAEPLWGIGLGSPPVFPIAPSDNSFAVILPSTRPVQLKLPGLDPPYYVSDFLYSGNSVPDGVLTPHSLTRPDSLSKSSFPMIRAVYKERFRMAMLRLLRQR